MTISRAVALVVVLGTGVALAGCSDNDTSVGTGLPRQTGQQFGDAGRTLEGDLHVEENGCLTLDVTVPEVQVGEGLWVVWPSSASEQDGVVHLDGGELEDGARITGTGTLVTLDDLPEGDDTQSYFGGFGRFCGADEHGAVVFDEVESR